MRTLCLLMVAATLGACGGASESDSNAQRTTPTDPTAGEHGSSGDEDTARASSAELPPAGDLAAAVGGPQRSAENRARDVYRHPRETLEFFQIRPDMRVIEISPGGGWYTEILAPYLRGEGELVAAIPAPDGRRARYRQNFLDLQSARPGVFGDVQIVTFDTPSPMQLGPDGSADMVLTFRNTHNMMSDSAEREAYAEFFRVLEAGGILGVVQHRAAEGADARESAEQGYVPQAYVVEIAEAAGFEFEEASEINANPADTRDYPEGVWSLPPVLRLGETDRARFEQIGESDRMTLRFRKPE